MTQKKIDRIRMYYQDKGKTQDQAAKKFNVTRESVSLLKKSAWHLETYLEMVKERNRKRYERYKTTELSKYEKTLNKIKSLGYSNVAEYISEHGYIRLQKQQRLWNI